MNWCIEAVEFYTMKNLPAIKNVPYVSNVAHRPLYSRDTPDISFRTRGTVLLFQI